MYRHYSYVDIVVVAVVCCGRVWLVVHVMVSFRPVNVVDESMAHISRPLLLALGSYLVESYRVIPIVPLGIEFALQLEDQQE